MIQKFLHSILKSYRNLSSDIRKILYRFRYNKFSKGSYISTNVQLRKCIIGSYTSIGPNSVLNHAIIGSYCSLASDVMIGGEEHAYWDISTSNHLSDNGISENDTIIGHDVWIGAQCYIRQGIKIGDGAVIGSNSFVNKDVPEYAIVAGSPARIIKYRFDEKIIKKIKNSRYWEYNPVKARAIIDSLSNGNDRDRVTTQLCNSDRN